MQSSLERYCRHSLSLLWQFPWWWMILFANIGWILDGSNNDAHCVKRLMLMIFQKWAIRARIGTGMVRGAQEALNLCHRQPPTSLFITSCDSISIDIRTSRSIGNSLIITRKGLISTLQHSLCPWAPRFLKESVSTTWCVYFLFFIIIHRSEPRQQNWYFFYFSWRRNVFRKERQILCTSWVIYTLSV